MVNTPEQIKIVNGPITEQIPQFIAEGRVLASIAYLIDQRLTTQNNNIKEKLQTGIFQTGDALTIYGNSGILLTLDAELLQKPIPVGKLCSGTLKLSDEEWQSMKELPTSLYLTPDEVEKVTHGGYVFRKKTWQPENKYVGKVIEFLTRGQDLKQYIKLVDDVSRKGEFIRYDERKVLDVRFRESEYEFPLMTALSLNSLDLFSSIGSTGDLTFHLYFLAGIKLHKTTS